MAVRVFRFLLRLYPRDFRERYERELIEFFVDERTRVRRRTFEALGFRLITLRDLLATAIRLRAAQRRHPNKTGVNRRFNTRNSMEQFWQDTKFALRGMAKHPSMTVVIVMTMALGMGANSAIFSVINSVVLRPLPYEDPDGIVFVWERNYVRDLATNVVSPANYIAWREQADVFSDMGAIAQFSATVTGGGEPERIGAVYLSPWR